MKKNYTEVVEPITIIRSKLFKVNYQLKTLYLSLLYLGENSLSSPELKEEDISIHELIDIVSEIRDSIPLDDFDRYFE